MLIVAALAALQSPANFLSVVNAAPITNKQTNKKQNKYIFSPDQLRFLLKLTNQVCCHEELEASRGSERRRRRRRPVVRRGPRRQSSHCVAFSACWLVLLPPFLPLLLRLPRNSCFSLSLQLNLSYRPSIHLKTELVGWLRCVNAPCVGQMDFCGHGGSCVVSPFFLCFSTLACHFKIPLAGFSFFISQGLEVVLKD